MTTNMTKHTQPPTLRHWPALQSHPILPPLLLVHGAFAGARLWEKSYGPAFAALGMDTWAMDFSTQNDGPLRRHRRGLKQLTAELAAAIQALPRPPVVLGYSLGGLVVQRLAQQQPLRGMVLLNALPTQDVPKLLLDYARRHPVSLAMCLSLAVASPVRHLSRQLPAGIASPQADAALQAHFVQNLRGESLRALLESLKPQPSASCTPSLVIGMEGDALIPPAIARAIAARLNADLRVFEGLSHTPMIEPEGQQVVQVIADWLEKLPPP
jgi:pimeloyl-ACP methyl ester carboxylesterase